jgi:type VI secretion system secreted protein Hcp
MAADMFLKLGTIKGESGDAKHGGEIEVLSWSWGMSQSASMHSNQGGGSGKVSVNDINITKYVDVASPTLMKMCAKGDHIEQGLLTVRKAGGTALEYLKINLTKVIISQVSTGGSGGEDRLTETINLNFQKVDFTYTPQNADGSGGGQVFFKFDIPAGTVT